MKNHLKRICCFSTLIFSVTISVRAGISETPWPVLAYVNKEEVYIPIFGEFPKNPPAELFGYSWNSTALPTSSVGQIRLTLEKTTGEVPTSNPLNPNSSGPKTYRALIYKPVSTTGLKGAQFILVFGRPETLQLRNLEKSLEYFDSASHQGFGVVQLSSAEGNHYILQTRQDGKCVRAVDYYHYLGYDLEADSEATFKKALCGKVLTPDKLEEKL